MNDKLGPQQNLQDPSDSCQNFQSKNIQEYVNNITFNGNGRGHGRGKGLFRRCVQKERRFHVVRRGLLF